MPKRIDDRLEEAAKRKELGHRVMNCIESGKIKGRACLLVLVDKEL